jgi:hypothetical protein
MMARSSTAVPRRWRVLLFFGAALALGHPGLAQQTPQERALIWQTFERKAYAAFLRQLPDYLATSTPPQPLPLLLAVAITLEQTQSGTLASLPAVTHRLPTAAQETIELLRALLRGDATAGARLPADSRLAPHWEQAAGLCQTHGYTTGGQVCAVMGTAPADLRLQRFIALPLEWQATLRTIWHTPARRLEGEELARLALRQSLQAPVGGSEEGPLFEAALRLDRMPSCFSFHDARELARAKKNAQAHRLVTHLAEHAPGDVYGQLAAARFLWQQLGNREAALARFSDALRTVPDPDRREIRLAQLAFLRWAGQDQTLYALGTDPDPLVAGDAMLALGKTADAAQLYRQLWQDLTQPVPRRLAAWAGWLDAAPADALAEQAAVGMLIARSSAPERAHLLQWTGQQLGGALQRALPMRFRHAELARAPLSPLAPLAPQGPWLGQTVALLQQLLTLDPNASLCPPTPVPSLRETAVLALTMAGEADLAWTAAMQPVASQVRPPATEPRITAPPGIQAAPPQPSLAEVGAIVHSVLVRCAALPSCASTSARLSARFLQELCAPLPPPGRNFDLVVPPRDFATIYASTIAALETDASSSATALTPMEREHCCALLVRSCDLLASHSAAHALLAILIAQGFTPALTSCRHPELLAFLTRELLRMVDACPPRRNSPTPVSAIIQRLIDELQTRTDSACAPLVVALRARLASPSPAAADHATSSHPTQPK